MIDFTIHTLYVIGGTLAGATLVVLVVLLVIVNEMQEDRYRRHRHAACTPETDRLARDAEPRGTDPRLLPTYEYDHIRRRTLRLCKHSIMQATTAFRGRAHIASHDKQDPNATS